MRKIFAYNALANIMSIYYVTYITQITSKRLADRTNDRAYPTMLCPSVCCLSSVCDACIVARAIYYPQPIVSPVCGMIGTKMNDLDLCLAVV